MKPVEIQTRIQSLQHEIKVWEGRLERRQCNTCVHFNHAPGCSLANGAVPPSDVQRTGCPSWAWDEIPF